MNGRWAHYRLPADIALAVGCTVMAMLLGREDHPTWPSFDAPAYVLTALANLPVMFRRKAPVAVMLACQAAWFCYISLGYWPVLNAYGCFAALYTIAMMRSTRTTLLFAFAASAEWVYAGLLHEESSMPSVVTQAAVYAGGICAFGFYNRKAIERNRELARLTRQLRHEQEERAYRAVVDERLRIAAELHDVVAHHTAVISVQAGMADFVFDKDPGQARGAIGVIANASREAQSELRRMLSLMRRRHPADSGETIGATGVAGIGELCERMCSAGIATELVVTGAAYPLPPGLDLCVYRVVQESLTNVLKHAPGASVTVALRYAPRHVEAEIRNSGKVIAAGKGSGHGLIGMNERARIYGGTLSAGPRPDGGFGVLLRVPVLDPQDDQLL